MSAFLKNLPEKVLSDRCLSVWSPRHPPLHTVYTPVLIHTGKWGRGGRCTIEKVRWALVHYRDRKYQHDGLYLQSINSIDYQWRRHWGFGVFIDVWSLDHDRTWWICPGWWASEDSQVPGVWPPLYSKKNTSVGVHTLVKKKENVFIYKEIQNGAVAKSYMTNGLLIYGEIFAHFGSPSSYMTLQLLHSEFPQIWFSFLSV